MTISSLRILLRFDWRDAANTVTRLWDGAGPYVDADGQIWLGAGLVTGLDAIEQAINGEAAGLSFMVSGISREVADRIWASHLAGDLVEGTVRILLQACDSADQPVGAPRIVYTGRVDNFVAADGIEGDRLVSQVTVATTNKFSFRRQPNGAVLSDADQRARSAILNPGAAPDRFAERVVLMQNKTVVWPRYNGG